MDRKVRGGKKYDIILKIRIIFIRRCHDSGLLPLCTIIRCYRY